LKTEEEFKLMNLKQKTKYEAALLTVCVGMVASSGVAFAKDKLVPLNDAEFEQAKSMYFQRCADCHGVWREGATGPSLEPYANKELKIKGTLKLGTKYLTKIITFGKDDMPNFDNIFSAKEIGILARYLQMEPPVPPEMPLIALF
jgi:nitrite reductase (NO-forming)/hydroxylamine reductase